MALPVSSNMRLSIREGGRSIRHNYRKLKVWQRAMALVTEVYLLSQGFPSNEQFGLTSQLRRAAISIPLNIAEGSGSESQKEFARFLNIALRSCYETTTALEIAAQLGICTKEELGPLLDETDQVAAMLVGLSRRIRSTTQSIFESEEPYLTHE